MDQLITHYQSNSEDLPVKFSKPCNHVRLELLPPITIYSGYVTELHKALHKGLFMCFAKQILNSKLSVQ